MSRKSAQNYASHRRWQPLYHFIVLPVMLVNVGVAFAQGWGVWSAAAVWQVVLAVGLVGTVLVGRVQALRVQDRVIRLEMRLRLREVLPDPLAARTGELSARQLVGLRFASDGELPGLVQRCLAGELAGVGAVKREVRDWQPDWLRA